MFIVKKEEEKTNEEKNKKINKKNITLYNNKRFIVWGIYYNVFIWFKYQPNNNKINLKKIKKFLKKC